MHWWGPGTVYLSERSIYEILWAMVFIHVLYVHTMKCKSYIKIQVKLARVSPRAAEFIVTRPHEAAAAGVPVAAVTPASGAVAPTPESDAADIFAPTS